MKLSVLYIVPLMAVMSQGDAVHSATSLALSDFSDLSGWRGLSADSSIRYRGLPVAKWEQAKSASVTTEAIPHDWSAYNCISFALYSDKATGSNFVLVLRSETPESEAMDYFIYRVSVDWTGWKRFEIPYTEMAIAGCPRGFSKIDSITMSADGWDCKPNPETVLRIADLRLTTIPSPAISDVGLFEMLNLDHPGLEKVKVLVEKRDIASAKHELAEYLRHRERPVWRWDWRPGSQGVPGIDEQGLKEAERYLTRELPSVGVYHKYEGEIDWTLNPMNYREWPWQLSRHHFWVTLGRAYRATGDEKYAREFVFQMLDWTKKCPVPKRVSGNASCTWRTIEAGIRMGQTWPEAYHLFLTSPSFTDEAIITMLKSFAEHARHLMRWPTTGNWLAMECNGLMHVGTIFPEFREAAEWRKTATDRLYAELDRQVYPDGAQIELTSGYHQVSLSNFVAAWEIAHLNGIPMPDDYVSKIQKMYDYNLNAAMPDGALPGLNDGNRTNIRGSLEKALTFFPDRKDYEWMATRGVRGEKPRVGSIALPFSGQLIMRTGWENEDLYLMMDAGPFGYGHQHEDALSIVLYSHGRYHLVDAGNYPYDSSQWRRYVISTRAHNTIMVDGLDQSRRGKPREQYVVTSPLPNKWVAGAGFDYASGMYNEGYGDGAATKVVHTRHIFFARPEYWIVTDYLKPADDVPHRYESMFHLDAENAEADSTSNAVCTTNKESSNLCIIPLADGDLGVRIVSGQEQPVVQGWLPAGGYTVRPIPTAIFEKKTAGRTSFVYVLYPVAAGAQCPVKQIERLDVVSSSGGEAVGVAIRFTDGRVDYYVQAEEPGKVVRFGGFESDAAATWVCTKDGKTIKACLAGGTRLMESGRRIEAEIREIEDLSRIPARHRF